MTLTCHHLVAMGYSGPHCAACHEDADKMRRDMSGSAWENYEVYVCCAAGRLWEWGAPPPEVLPRPAEGIRMIEDWRGDA